MKELGIMLNFIAKRITIDEIILPMRNINLRQGVSTLPVLKLNISLAMEPKITQDSTKCALSSSLVNCQGQSKTSKCRPREEVIAASHEI
jgi:hypothetical protein